MQKNKILIFIFIIIIFSFNSAFSSSSYTFAIYPSTSPDKIQKAFSPLVKYLSIKLNTNIKLVITKDYDELNERILNNSVDFAWVASANYIKLREIDKKIMYLATYIEKNNEGTTVIPYYSSVILSLKKNNIKSLEDAKNKRFAFTDKYSTSGFAYPMMLFKKHNIDPYKYFNRIFFLKKHDRVITSLVTGSIDVGAVSDGTYYNAVKKYGDIFNIIEISDPIPLDAVIASSKTNDHLAIRLKEILLSIPANHSVNNEIKENIGWNAAGFLEKNDSFYDSIREAQELLEKNR